ncbi:type I-B CRISPR-associated protein Cas7/Csh2 [Dehalococcoidia bacterium]|nr:type I-B CRISPR-associated protein Cas7/Csh2 [Dehalococcoidia bacterium]
MSSIIKNRSEILFIYDVTDANPNGDPMDENKPRIDEETGHNIVTDVRLKRTVRDYLHDFKEEEIFVREEREERDDTGNLKTKEAIYEHYGSPDRVKEKCVDIRLFGGTFALKRKGGEKKGKTPEEESAERAFALTGAVQFKFGRSLNKVGEPTFIRGTTVMPSGTEKRQGTFPEQYILPYSLIAFYGIVNENAAKTTRMTEADLQLLLEGLWDGTKNLITRSKMGQMPRFLLQVIYKEQNYHIGELDRRIKLLSDKRDEQIRDVSEIRLDLTDLARTLEENKDKIEKVCYAKDKRLTLVKGEQMVEVQEIATEIKFEPLGF